MTSANPILPTLQSASQAYEQGDYDIALKQCQEISRSGHETAELLHLMALCQRAHRDIATASRTILRALKKAPHNPSVLNTGGLIALDASQLAKAEQLFRRALKEDSSFAAALTNLGHTLTRKKRFEEAKRSYSAALDINPSLPDAIIHLGLLHRKAGEGEELDSLLLSNGVTALRDPGIALLRGLRALDLGNYRKSEQNFREGLELAPNSLPLAMNLGVAISKQDRTSEARDIFESLLESQGSNSDLLINLADTYKYENPVKARMLLSQALGCDEKNLNALDMYGFTWLLDGNFEEAIRAFDRALSLDPEFYRAIFHKACALFLVGNLQEAWPLYLTHYGPNGCLGSPIGETVGLAGQDDLSAESTVIWTDQGIGDQILQLGLVAQLEETGSKCTVVTSPRLRPLVQRSFSSVTCIDREVDPMAYGSRLQFETQCPAYRLGLYLRRNFSDFPETPSFLTADAGMTAELREKYQELSKGRPVIGLTWKSTNTEFGKEKSLLLSQLAPIIENPSYWFVNLQYGDTAEERDKLPSPLKERFIHDDEIDPMRDLDAQASQIMALDLVITISNSTAHLAGALGQKTWVMVPKPGPGWLWYWFYDRADSPWYPSISLFRQSEDGNWSSTVFSIKQRLAAFPGSAS